MSFEIHADHGHGGITVDTGERYISAFEGRSGDGWVLSVDRDTHRGTLMGNEVPKPLLIGADDPTGPVLLDPSEKIWIISCWMSILRESFDQIERRIFQAAMSRVPANIAD